MIIGDDLWQTYGNLISFEIIPNRLPRCTRNDETFVEIFFGDYPKNNRSLFSDKP
ncbi:hypothetical protein MNBD_GAMMA01-2140 [hydrothermal vent metagenome]|uniref:Uncharacterized protein n=1 Tax=hydrothermal vent metagenome TaxID=652676 RepID=A0A3B0WAU6_9ZZZZ